MCGNPIQEKNIESVIQNARTLCAADIAKHFQIAYQKLRQNKLEMNVCLCSLIYKRGGCKKLFLRKMDRDLFRYIPSKKKIQVTLIYFSKAL